MKNHFYIIEDKTPVPVENMEEWVDLFKDMGRVAADTYGTTLVSTVFLGIDHSFGGKPLLFETMIFGGKHDGYQKRCSTWDEAISQHGKACSLVRNKYITWIKKILRL